MTVNAKIKASDYNDIRNGVTSVLGTGAGNFGYGQPVRSNVVNLDSRVSINDWAQLKYDIQSVYRHQTNADPPTIAAVPDEGSKIRSNTTNSPYTQYNTLKNTLQTNRFVTPPLGRRATATYPGKSTVWPGPYGEYWRTKIIGTVTCVWNTAEQARHFFNAGGEIRISSRRIPPETSTLNNATQGNSWGTLLTNVGTRSFGANIPGTGTGGTQQLNGQNFFRLSNNYTDPYVSESLSSPYSLSKYELYAKCDVANNTSGGAKTVVIQVVFDDSHVGSGGGPDRIDGEFEINASTLYASGALVPSGTFTITPPTVTITAPIPEAASSTASYTITPNVTSVNEGGSVTFTVQTSGLVSGTTLYWEVFGGPGITPQDFSAASGTASINSSGTATITISPTNDFLLEGTEFFFLEIKNSQGKLLAASNSVNIGDTSRTFTFGVTQNFAAYNLRQRAITAGWNQTDRLEFIVYTPARLYGNSNSSYNGSGSGTATHATVGGLIVDGEYPQGLIIRNYGTIVGAGGVGGAGASAIGSSASNGTHGGAGLVIVAGMVSSFSSTDKKARVFNQSEALISGGGGGGGGAPRGPGMTRGGGGGGGAPFGPGGSLNGQTATSIVGGSGGNPGTNVGYFQGGHGGNEGQPGAEGSDLHLFNTSGSPGQGGAAGYSIVGTSSITLTSVSGSYIQGNQLFAPSN